MQKKTKIYYWKLHKDKKQHPSIHFTKCSTFNKSQKNLVGFVLWPLFCVLLLISCQGNTTSSSTTNTTTQICLLEKDQVNYRLQSYVQILEEKASAYTIQDVLQAPLQNQFQAYPNHNLDIQNYKYYWGKLQMENRLTKAAAHTEWVLSLSNTWTDLDIFIQGENGDWKQERNGTFTPEYSKNFRPTARGNLVKISLPPQELITVYFRGISERKAINPSFYLRLRHIDYFYVNLLETKVSNAFFMGFLLMMFLYNLILYFYGRDRSFLFYSGYLIMMVIYAGYLADDFVDWFELSLFAQYPQYSLFLKFD